MKNTLFKKINKFFFQSASFFYLLFSSQVGSATAIKPMTYEDIVNFAKPQWAEISGDAQKLAFSVRKGSIEKNCNLDILYLFDIKNEKQQQIGEFEKIIQAKWGNQDKHLYFLAKDGDIHKLMCWNGAEIIALVQSQEPIYLFTLSADGSSLYYSLIKNCNSEEFKKQEIEEGHVYTIDQDFLIKIIKGDYAYKEREEIWCLDLISGNSEYITFLPAKDIVGQHYPIITSLEVAKDKKRLLVAFSKLGRPDLGGTPFDTDVIMWDSIQKEWYDPLQESIYIEDAPCWISEKDFIFKQVCYSEGMKKIDYSVWLFDAISHEGNKIDWINISDEIKKFQWNQGILYGISERFLYQIFLNEKRIEKIEIPKTFYGERLSFDEQGHHLGLIHQSIDHCPEVAVYDFSEKKFSRLTALHPQLEEMSLGKVEKMVLKTNSGLTANAFLIHPVGEEPGIRYPIIIGTYGFEGKFITDGEWHSSFPVQTLAGEGYAVLLLNAPWTSQGFIGDSETARQLEGWNKLELFEYAVDMLVERGIGDPNKVGIYGWSHGAFIVNFLISHSKKFHVACLGEGGDYNPAGFWAGGNFVWPKIYESTFGGPPWGDSLKNYLEFSPFFQVDKIRTPLLLEFASEADNAGLEMYVPLRYLGVPAELVIYDGEEHNFVRPKARIASMARKLEWFNFWLFDERNTDPKKQKQYERWEKMRGESFSLITDDIKIP
jgi:dienelactone hydrolase